MSSKKLPIYKELPDDVTNPEVQTNYEKGPVCHGCSFIELTRLAGAGEGYPSDIMLVSESPSWASANNQTHFMGKGGRIIRETLKQIIDDDNKTGGKLGFKKLKVFNTYAIQCQAEPDTIGASELDRCGTYLLSAIRHKKPKVIVAFGAKALKALGIKGGKFEESRGRTLTIGVGGDSYTVLPTFGVRALLVSPGLYNFFHSDLYRAMRIATGIDHVLSTTDIGTLTENYRIPKTIEEVKSICDEIIDYAVRDAVPQNSAISVDIETNTLLPHHPRAKVLCISFSWDTGRAAAIPLWHKECPYSPEEAILHVKRVLESPKPKVFHNAKFDLKFLERRCGLTVNNVQWCSLLGEHLIREDQQGSYSLKVLGRSYFPEFTNYADHIHDIASAASEEDEEVQKDIENAVRAIKKKKPKSKAIFEPVEEPIKVIDLREDASDDEITAFFDAFMEAPPPKKKRSARKKKIFVEDATELFQDEFDTIPSLSAAELNSHLKGDKKEQKAKREDNVNYEKVSLYGNNGLLIYAAIDTDLTRRLLRNQLLRMREENFLTQGRALMKIHAVPASRALGKMEYDGVKVDRNHLDVIEQQLTTVIDRTSREISRHWNLSWGEFNPNSTHHLGRLLYSEGVFDKSGERQLRLIPGVVELNEKSKNWKTDKATLRGIVEYAERTTGEKCPFTVALLDYRAAHKAKSGFLTEIRHLSSLDGYLHTNFHIHGTSTGRTSSSGINLQNWPKSSAGVNIKKLLTVDNDDELFVNLDYKGAEIRIFSAYSKDARLIEALINGMDAHCFFVSEIYGYTYEEVLQAHKKQLSDVKKAKKISGLRDDVKRVVFGILYGAGPHKIAETAKIPVERAQEVINQLMSMFPSIRKYVEDTRSFIREYGYVDTFFGRRRRFPLYAMGSYFRSLAERRGVNMKIQSTSSDIVIGQLIELNDHIKEVGGQLKLTVHDSIGMTVKKKYAHQLPDFLEHYCVKRVTQKYPFLPVPFSCDIEIGPNYGELTELRQYLKTHRVVEPNRDDQISQEFDLEVMEELREIDPPPQETAA